MAHPPEFDDAWLRIDRAKENTKRLGDEIRGWWPAQRDRYGAVTKHDGKGNVQIVARVGDRPPKEWGLLVGDILVDLRSALDYAVWALAVKRRKGKITDPKSVAFPIILDDKNWPGSGHGSVKHVPPLAEGFIEKVQPYHPEYGGTSGKESPLWMLDELVNISKHRVIPLMVTALTLTAIDLNFLNADIEKFRSYPVGELKNGTVLATFRAKAKANYAYVKVKPTLTLRVAFEESSPYGVKDVWAGVSELGGPVQWVISELERYV